MISRRKLLRNALLSGLALPLQTALFGQKGSKAREPRQLIKARILRAAKSSFASASVPTRLWGKPVPAWAQGLGIRSRAQYFLKFIFASPEIQFTMPATSRVDNIKDNMQAAVGVLPNAEQKERMRREFMAH